MNILKRVPASVAIAALNPALLEELAWRVLRGDGMNLEERRIAAGCVMATLKHSSFAATSEKRGGK